MCCTRLAENTERKNSPSSNHGTNLSGYIVAIKACVDNFGSLTAEIRWRVWSTSANFNEFRVLASLLHRRRSKEVNQTLHDVWPSPGLVHGVYFFGDSCPVTEFCKVQSSLCVQILRSPSYISYTYISPAAIPKYHISEHIVPNL